MASLQGTGKQRNERGYFGGGHNSETQWDRDPLHAVDNLTKREPERTEVSFPALAIVQKEEGALIQVRSLFPLPSSPGPNGTAFAYLMACQGGEERLIPTVQKEHLTPAFLPNSIERPTTRFFGGVGFRGGPCVRGVKGFLSPKSNKEKVSRIGGGRGEESKEGGRRNDFVLGMRRGILLPPPLSGKSRWKVVEEEEEEDGRWKTFPLPELRFLL